MPHPLPPAPCLPPSAAITQRLLHSRLLRWLAAWRPRALQPHLPPYGLVVELGADGRQLRALHDPTGAACHTITWAVEVGGTLDMGSLGHSHVCALDLGEATAATAAAAA